MGECEVECWWGIGEGEGCCAVMLGAECERNDGGLPVVARMDVPNFECEGA